MLQLPLVCASGGRWAVSFRVSRALRLLCHLPLDNGRGMARQVSRGFWAQLSILVWKLGVAEPIRTPIFSTGIERMPPA